MTSLDVSVSVVTLFIGFLAFWIFFCVLTTRHGFKFKRLFYCAMDLDEVKKDGRKIFKRPAKETKIQIFVFVLGVVFGLVLCLGLFWG